MVINVVTIDKGLVSFHSFDDVLTFFSTKVPFPKLVIDFFDDTKESVSVDMDSIVSIDIKLNDDLIEDWFHCAGAKGVAFYG